MPLSADLAGRILAMLNEPQREAATYGGRALLILAGAGSGKTRALTCRIALGVASGRVRAGEVLAVTFSNRAANELKTRLRSLLSLAFDAPFLGITFHSAGLRILRAAVDRGHPVLPLEPGFTIYDDTDQTALVRRVLADLGLPSAKNEAQPYQRAINKDKGSARTVEEAESSPAVHSLGHYARVARAYEAALRRANAVDFGDLLLMPLILMRADEEVRQSLQERFRWVLVDEFQDTNKVQMELVRALWCAHTHLAVVGDDDQSIYRWRGAKVENILGFPGEFEEARVVRLEQNYRSTGHILAAANSVIAQNEHRHPKLLWTDEGEGEPVRLMAFDGDREEARHIAGEAGRAVAEAPPNDDPWSPHTPVAVFYRTHAQSMLIEEALRADGVPHRVYGGLRFFERKEVKDALAYARLLVNAADDEAFLRVVNVPARGIGRATVEAVLLRARESGVPALQAASDLAREEKKGAGARVERFVKLVARLGASVEGLPAGEALSLLVDESGLRAALEAEDTVESEARLENLGALVNAAADYDRESEDQTLMGFLERLALRDQTEELDQYRPHVALMTLHNAKGLEFDHVIVTGVEDGLLPHANSDWAEAREEERRLFYVGMTRARRRLTLTHAGWRQRFGSILPSDPSPFLLDLPDEHVESVAPAFGFARARRPAPRPRRKQPQRAGGRHWADDLSQEPARGFDLHPGSDSVVGRRVRHSRFGRGVIDQVVGRPGPDAIVVVLFDGDPRPRRIVARFLEPDGS